VSRRRHAGAPVWHGLALAFAGLTAVAPVLRAAEPVPVIAQSAAGRFEVAAVDSTQGHAIAALAEEGWRILTAPLDLPAQFATPVFVRVVPSASAGFVAPFFATAESGGVVSVRLRAEAASPAVVRRAIVRGLLLRLAVAQQGVRESVRVPRWLEEGALAWWQTRASMARLDEARQESLRRSPPALGDVLAWQAGPVESPGFAVASLWLMTYLQAESRRGTEWPALIRALLAGDDPDLALAALFPGRFANEAERELWWQTGWHHVARARTLPALEPAESRGQLATMQRFVFSDATGERDQVLALADVLARAGEPIVAAELARRATELNRLVPVLHPFYRNAGIALTEALAARALPPEQQAERVAAFEADWRDARELEAATTAALDALEARLREK
jgi:hypothetical protein